MLLTSLPQAPFFWESSRQIISKLNVAPGAATQAIQQTRNCHIHIMHLPRFDTLRLSYISITHLAGMFRARPRWTVSASGLAVPGRPGPPTPHFYRQGLGRPGPQPLTFIDRAQPQTPHFYWPTPHFYWPTPHFYWPAPHFYWPDPSLLLGRPLTSIGQTPHFY